MSARGEVCIGDMLLTLRLLGDFASGREAQVCQLLRLNVRSTPVQGHQSVRPVEPKPEKSALPDPKRRNEDSSKSARPELPSKPQKKSTSGHALPAEQVIRPDLPGWWLSTEPVDNHARWYGPELSLFDERTEPELLRTLLTSKMARGPLDLTEVVDRLSKGKVIQSLRREMIRVLAPVIQILLDRRERMSPFYEDQNELVEKVQRIAGTQITVDSFVSRPQEVGPLWAPVPWRVEEPGAQVVIVSDLRSSLETGCESRHWRLLGRSLLDAGVKPIVLSPVPPARLAQSLGRYFDVQYWDRRSRPQDLRKLLFGRGIHD